MIPQEQWLQDGRHFIDGREVFDRQPRGLPSQQQRQLDMTAMEEQQQYQKLPDAPPRNDTSRLAPAPIDTLDV